MILLEVIKTEIEGLLIIKPKVFGDERGYFFESYNEDNYREAGIDFYFVQDNISKSKKGTIRGLHYQVGDMAQGKLCKVIFGKVLDVAVDIRFGSPTFGKKITRSFGFHPDLHMAFLFYLKKQFFLINVQRYTVKNMNVLSFLMIKT